MGEIIARIVIFGILGAIAGSLIIATNTLIEIKYELKRIRSKK